MTPNTQNKRSRPRSLSTFLRLSFLVSLLRARIVDGFAPIAFPTTVERRPVISDIGRDVGYRETRVSPITSRRARVSESALSVWWFGGTEEPVEDGEDSCELVAVRIERTSPNSRRIAGDITVPTSLEDVWAVLTDYDRLSTHVPNLVESRRMPSARSHVGEQGDGQYQCRLYQKGAQKIVGFEFGASLTMDMAESVVNSLERTITFKCVESPFFSEFDGEWKVTETKDEDGQPQCTVSYLVDVRPRGPVPVAALEWRIREDVPTNLRAVKRAATEVGYAGVMAARQPRRRPVAAVRNNLQRNAQAMRKYVGQAVAQSPRRLQPVTMKVQTDWGDDETMAAYL